MQRRPPITKRTDTLYPYTTLFRSKRRTERQVTGAISVALAIEGDTIKFHAVVDEPVSEPLGDHLLQRFEFGIDEFDDLARLDVDQMVVMLLGCRLIARAAVAEIVAVENPRLFEQAYDAVNGGRSEERSVGKGCVCKCRIRGAP